MERMQPYRRAELQAEQHRLTLRKDRHQGLNSCYINVINEH
jgi:hypothetical protein